MLQINDLEVIRNKRVVVRVPEMILPEASINAIVGGQRKGKSLLTRTIHGIYRDYKGMIDFQNLDKLKSDSYLLTKEIILLRDKSVSFNLSYGSKKQLDTIYDYAFMADLENELQITVQDLSTTKQRLVELAIACGFNPSLLIIDDFDKCYSHENLAIVGKLLSKYKSEGGSVLLTSSLKVPEMDNTFTINEDGVVS